MRFTIAREKLQEALTSVAPAVPAKTTLPVLANILVEASDRGVRFSGTASNSKTWMTSTTARQTAARAMSPIVCRRLGLPLTT